MAVIQSDPNEDWLVLFARKREISDSLESHWFHHNTADFSRVLPSQYGPDTDQHLSIQIIYQSSTVALQG